MHRRWLRILAIVVGALVVITVAVRVLLPAEKIKDFLFDQLRARTGIVATAEEASISFPWPVGLRLQGLVLDSPEGGLPDGSRFHVEAGEALATAELMSLLRKKPQVQELRLRAPFVEYWMAPPKEGAEEGPGTGSGGEGASPAAGAALALGLVSVQDGRLVLHPAAGGLVEVDGLDQSARFQLQESGRFVGRLQTSVASLRYDGGRGEPPVELPSLSTELLVEGSTAESTAEIQVERLEMEGLQAEGDLSAAWTSTPAHLEADLRWTGDVAELWKRWGDRLPPTPLGAYRLGAREASGTLRYAGPVPPPEEGGSPLPAGLQIDGSVAGLRLAALGLDPLAEGDLDFRVQREGVALREVRLRARGLSAAGQLDLPAAPEGEVTGRLDLQADVGPLAELAGAVWPALPESLTAGKTPPGEWPGVRGGLRGPADLAFPFPPPEELPASAVRARLEVVHLGLVHESLSDSLRLDGGSLLLDPRRIVVEGVGVAGPGLAGRAEGRVEGWPEQIRLEGSLQLSLLDVDRLRPAEDQGQALRLDALLGVGEARAQAQGEASALPAPPENLSADVDLACERARSHGYELTGLKGKARLQSRVLDLQDLEGALGSGRLSGQGSVDWTVEPPRWRARAHAQEVPAGSLVGPVAPKLGEALEAAFSGDLVLDGPAIPDAERVKQALTGQGSFSSTAGVLLTTPILGEGLSALPGQAAQRFQELPFSRFLTSLRIDEGRVHFDETLLDGPTQVRAAGYVGLDGRVDYSLQIKLPAGEKVDLGSFTPLQEFLRADDGRITIPLEVSGPAGKPKVSLQMGAAEQRARGAAGDALKDNLRNLLGGAKADSSAADSTKSLEDEAKDALKGLLKGLGGKKGGGGR